MMGRDVYWTIFKWFFYIIIYPFFFKQNDNLVG